jgi:hypothetical protein
MVSRLRRNVSGCASHSRRLFEVGESHDEAALASVHHVLELARQPDTPVLFQPIRDHLARAIAALSDEKSWLNAGRTSRNRKQAARKVLRFAVLTALDEQTSIKMWLPTAGRGPAGAVLKAVMREADRLDSRPPRARDAEIKLADWNRRIREWDQRERPEERF